MKTYAVKEIFGPTISGEGSLAGQVTLFLRFAGCNMWDGREASKLASGCPYCDTDFVGGTRMSATEIVAALRAMPMRRGGDAPWVTVSGGEPLLQYDLELSRALLGDGFRVAIETNGTRGLPAAASHITMSPKVPRSEVVLAWADDIKVLWPHPNPAITPESFADFPAHRRFLQPINDDTSLNGANVEDTLRKLYELAALGERWSLSVQLHKVLGVK